MSNMRVRIEVEIFDELGESTTLVGASKRINASGNPLFFGHKFDEIVDQIRQDIRNQIIRKHRGLKAS